MFNYTEIAARSLILRGYVLEEVVKTLHPLWEDIDYLLRNYVDIPEGLDDKVDKLRIAARDV